MSAPRVAVFVDHDIIIRHFIQNGVLPSLESQFDVVFVFPHSHRRVNTDLAALPLKRYRTLEISEQRAYLYRRLYHATVLKRARSRDDKQAIFSFWRESLGLRGFWESWLCSWPGFYHHYRSRTLSRIGRNDALERLMAEEAPDIVLHPTVLEGLFVSDLVRWGRTMHTPTLFIMNSWDNPYTKAMMDGYPDCLAVWGEQTRRIAISNLGMPEQNVVSLGAAQFDLYRSPVVEAAEDYRRRMGIASDKRLLLYAGSSKGLNETCHLLMLEQAVEAGELANCAIVFRPHPWRSYPAEEEDFYAVRWKHVMMAPEMEACYRQSRDAKRIRIGLADYRDTHVTLSAADAVVSPVSTILLEAAMHGKPILAYMPEEEIRDNNFVRTMANLSFMREFFARFDCGPCTSSSDFVAACGSLLKSVDLPGIGDQLKERTTYFVDGDERPYGNRLASLIETLIDGRQAARRSGAAAALAGRSH